MNVFCTHIFCSAHYWQVIKWRLVGSIAGEVEYYHVYVFFVMYDVQTMLIGLFHKVVVTVNKLYVFGR